MINLKLSRSEHPLVDANNRHFGEILQQTRGALRT